MTKQTNNDPILTTPVDMTKDQVEETRRVLREMWDKAEAIDAKIRPVPCPLSGVKRTCRFALHMSAFDPKRTSVAPFPVLFWAGMMRCPDLGAQ